MLMRCAATGFGGTSWRSQLSNKTTFPASAGITNQGRFWGVPTPGAAAPP